MADAALKDGGVPKCRVNGPSCTIIATQVDHKVPIEAGGARLDPNNLRPSCGPCNGGRAAKMKARDGWRRARTRVILVVGAPGAGKSTYVRERAAATDLVIDYDEISAALGPTLPHGSRQRHDAVMAARNALLTKVRRGELDVTRAWIISTNTDAERIFPHHELIVVDPGIETVLQQAAEASRPERFVRVIKDWYRKRESRSSTDGGRGSATPSREW